MTYESPALRTSVGGSASERAHAIHVKAENGRRDPQFFFPAFPGGWDLGFLQPSEPERKIRPDKAFLPKSQVGLWQGMTGTKVRGQYLDRMN